MITLCYCPECEVRTVKEAPKLKVLCMECGKPMIRKIVDKPMDKSSDDRVFELPEWFEEEGWEAPTDEVDKGESK